MTPSSAIVPDFCHVSRKVMTEPHHETFSRDARAQDTFIHLSDGTEKINHSLVPFPFQTSSCAVRANGTWNVENYLCNAMHKQLEILSDHHVSISSKTVVFVI